MVSGGATSNGATFTISHSTDHHFAESKFGNRGWTSLRLTVNGSGFASGAVVNFNGSALSATTFVSAAQVTAVVPASLIATSGTALVTVFSGGVTSNSAGLPITGGGPPTITAAPLLIKYSMHSRQMIHPPQLP